MSPLKHRLNTINRRIHTLAHRHQQTEAVLTALRRRRDRLIEAIAEDAISRPGSDPAYTRLENALRLTAQFTSPPPSLRRSVAVSPDDLDPERFEYAA